MRRMRGAALLVALVLLGVIGGLITRLSGDFVLERRRAQNLLEAEQAWQYLVGMEGIAAAVLAADDPTRDHTAEAWAAPIVLDLPGGARVSARIEDLQGRLPLNALRRARSVDGAAEEVPSTEPERRFIRLLVASSGGLLDQQDARALIEALVDWLDPDDVETGFGGAETSHFRRQIPPIRPANGPARSVSELRVLPGVSPELYERIAPLLSVWPLRGATVNINTAPPPVLLALLQEASVGTNDLPERLVEARQESGFDSIGRFLDIAGEDATVDIAGLSLRSDWFLVHSEVLYRGEIWRLQSVLQRRKSELRIVARAMGEL